MQTSPSSPADDDADEGSACVLSFNANDPSGAGGLSADWGAIASVGAHALPVTTGVYLRDSGGIQGFAALDDELVADQARAVLEDMPVQVFKVGFAGSPENLSAIAQICAEYDSVPLITWMPDLAWWDDNKADLYQDACSELLLPQTTILVGNHGTLARWLLPSWSGAQPPSPRDIARAAAGFDVPYVLVTGISQPDQFINNVLCDADTELAHAQFERIEASFIGAGDTLSAALAALLASGTELGEAATEALAYMDRCLDSGFHPGMGSAMPDRLFWAHAEDPPEGDEAEPADAELPNPASATRH